MALPTGLVLGITAMILWGINDYLLTLAVRKTGVFRTYLWERFIGLIFLIILYLFFFYEPIPWSFTIASFVIIMTLSGTIGQIAFYKGLKKGNVSVVSPLANSWPLVTVLVSIIFLKEAPTMLQILAIIILLFGGALISFRYKDLFSINIKKAAVGVPYALVALLCWGIYFVFLDLLVERIGWFLPIFLGTILIIVSALPYAKITNKNISIPTNVLIILIFAGVFEDIALFLYAIAVSSEFNFLIAPLGALVPLITIILAWILLKEKLVFNQYIGIIVVLVGLVLIAI